MAVEPPARRIDVCRSGAAAGERERDAELVAQQQVLDHGLVALMEEGSHGVEKHSE
jgi:hypothetical protein